MNNLSTTKAGVCAFLWLVAALATGPALGQRAQETASRLGASSTTLPDGRVLIIGGLDNGTPAAQASIHDPKTNSMSILPAQLRVARANHSATLLPNGQILILGGAGPGGDVIDTAEVFSPATVAFESIGRTELISRTGHTATVLTDGKLLVVGGTDSQGRPVAQAEVFDPTSARSEVVGLNIVFPRTGHAAYLLADGRVLILGGRIQEARAINTAELFDPSAVRFFDIGVDSAEELLVGRTAPTIPGVAASMPEAGATDVGAESIIALRFNKPMGVATVNAETVTLLGPEGVVPIRVVPVEDGMLAFVTPERSLWPASRYSLFVDGAIDAAAVPLPLHALGFSTARLGGTLSSPAPSTLGPLSAPGMPADASPNAQGAANSASDSTPDGASADVLTTLQADPSQGGEDDEDWRPGPENQGGRWRTFREQAQSVRDKERAAIQHFVRERGPMRRVAISATGSGAIAGHVHRLNDQPLANVRVNVGSVFALTDGEGHFELTGVPAGRQELVIDGRTAGRYVQVVVGVDVESGKTAELPQVVYLPRIRPRDELNIPSPTVRETVLTHPDIPGLELRLPKGTVIRERDGRIVTRLAIVPVPLDRSPFATPENFPVYFTIQPGGAVIQALSREAAQGVRLIYPNYTGHAPGTLMDFWTYEPQRRGWYVYSKGRVTADGKQVAPDHGHGLYEAMHGGHSPAGGPPGPTPASPYPPCGKGGGPCACKGDPVDCATGMFVHRVTDLSVADVLPIDIERTYRPGDTTVRPFGIGATHPYAMYLYNPGAAQSAYSVFYVILPDGAQIRFDRISGGLHDGIWEHRGTPSEFFAARMTAPTFPNEHWRIDLKDGTAYTFQVGGGAPVTAMLDRFGNRLEFQRNGGLLQRVTTASGRFIEFTYDTFNRVKQLRDNIDRTVSYEYYAPGDTSPGAAGHHLKKVTWQVGGGEPDVFESYTYENNRMKTVVDRRGNTMVDNQYDGNGRVQQQTLGGDAIYGFSYEVDASGKVTQTSITDPRRFVTRLDFNPAGYVTSETRAHDTSIAQTTSYTRDATTGLIDHTVDHRGRRTEYEYDAKGNVKLVRRLAGTPDALTEQFEHTADFSQLEKYTDPRQKDTILRYEGPGLLREVEDPLGHKTTYQHNGAGQVTSMTRGAGENTIVTEFTYDVYDLRTVTVGGYTTTYTTDAVGRVAAVTDGRGNVTYNEYNALSRLRRVIDPLRKVTELNYDGNGNLTRVKDPGNTETGYTYDPRNRLETRTDAFQKSEAWHWDGNGNLHDYTDRRGNRTDYIYDELDRRTLATYADQTSTGTAYSFVGVEAEVVVTEGSQVITQRFDGLDRLRYEVTPQGRIDYGYDVASRMRSMQVQGQTELTYDWDDAKRLFSITRGGQAILVDHDEADRRKAITFPNGIKQQMNYGRAWARPTGIDYYQGSTLLEGQTDASFDADGRPELRTGAGTLPRTGLPNASSATYDRNRLTTFNGSSWTYDDQGNLESDGTRTYHWDVRNRLMAIKEGGTTVASFEYDAFNRRTARTVSGATTGYLHDGLTPVQEQTGGGSTQLISGLGIDDYLARIEPTRTRYYLTDFLGSTVGLANEAGDIVTRYTYEPYGETGVTGEVSSNRLQYTGRENDGTGLYYYRARYYHPGAKRFISEDPIGLAGGLNPYVYVSNNPISRIDPLGLQDSDVFGGGRSRPPIGLPDVSQKAQRDLARQLSRLLREKVPPSDDDARDRRRKAEDECYEQCKDLLDCPDLQSSDYRRCYRRCMFDKGFPGLPPD